MLAGRVLKPQINDWTTKKVASDPGEISKVVKWHKKSTRLKPICEAKSSLKSIARKDPRRSEATGIQSFLRTREGSQRAKKKEIDGDDAAQHWESQVKQTQKTLTRERNWAFGKPNRFCAYGREQPQKSQRFQSQEGPRRCQELFNFMLEIDQITQRKDGSPKTKLWGNPFLRKALEPRQRDWTAENLGKHWEKGEKNYPCILQGRKMHP